MSTANRKTTAKTDFMQAPVGRRRRGAETPPAPNSWFKARQEIRPTGLFPNRIFRETCGQFLTALLLLNAEFVAAATDPAATAKSAPIPWSQIGVKAGADYQGDGLAVTPAAGGARLRCVFQGLEGQATRDGLLLTSTVTNSMNHRFHVVATAVGRAAPVAKPSLVRMNGASSPRSSSDDETSPKLTKEDGCTTSNGALPRTGTVSMEGQTVRFIRRGLVEEYTVSTDGVRQDFVIIAKPEGTGELRVALAVDGARVEPAAGGAQLVLAQSGRKIAYTRLRVTDATGRELPARMEVVRHSILAEFLTSTAEWQTKTRAEDRAPALAVVVNDAEAVYPVRIDPTFSDANWISMGGLPGADGDVYAVALDGSGNLYIGGSFTAVGDVLASKVAKWNGSSWVALDSGINGQNGEVYALAVSGSDVYVGGLFSTADGSAAMNIAKWNGSTWSALGSGMNGKVLALAVSGSDVYAGGLFSTAGGSAAMNIAKWNGSSWSALGSGAGINGENVSALAVSGSDVYAGGHFTRAGGSAATNIAKWNGSTWSALGSGIIGDGFIPDPTSVYALAVSGTDVYAGGYFIKAGGTAATNIAKWNGSSWSALGSGTDGQVSALAVSGSDVYAGGNFSTAGGSAATSIAKWNGTSWSALGSGINCRVLALAVSGSDVYVGASFITAGGSAATNLAKWNGSNWSALGAGANNLGVNGPVRTLAVSGSDVYAGGVFTGAGGSSANYVAKWNGSSWSPLGSGMNGEVSALAVSGSDVYAGGFFTTAGGSPASYIAKWNGSTWSALGSGMNGKVLALAVSGSDVYAGGLFSTAGGSPASYVAKWNGSSWTPLASGVNAHVSALAMSGSDVYAGGVFTIAGGSPASYIARWNGSSWSALGSGMDHQVFSLAVWGSDVYAGGVFTTAGGSAAESIAKWNGNSWSALGSGIISFQVQALAVWGNQLYVGGIFDTAGGIAASGIAKWDGSGWSALGSGVNRNGVEALAMSGGDLYAGGYFTMAGGKVSAYVARAVTCPSYSISPGTLPAGLVGGSYLVSLMASGGNPPYSFSVASGSLPPGLDLFSSGLLRGTNIAGGVYDFGVMVTDADGCTGTTNYTLTFTCPDYTILPATLPSGGAGAPYSSTLTMSGGGPLPRYSFSAISGLPPGLALATNGILSGTPPRDGLFSLFVRATNHECVVTTNYLVLIYPAYTLRPIPAQLNLPVPPVGTGGSGNPAQDIAHSSIFVTGVSTQWLKCVSVGLMLQHPRDGDLVIRLTPPGGAPILLANQRGGNGSDYSLTTFRNDEPVAVADGAAPFNGKFRPEALLAFTTHNGGWTLEIEDKTGGNAGVLLDWWLSFQGAPYPETNVLLWSAGLNSSAVSMVVDSGLAQSLHQTYVQQANRLSAFRNTDGGRAWEITLPEPAQLALLDGQFNELLILANTSGLVYARRPSDGASIWVSDTRRGSCPADSLSATPAIQVRRFSDPAFQSARANDLVFVVTDYKCGSPTANRVVALDGLTGGQVWNSSILGFALDRGTGLAVDYSRNTLYCTFDETVGSSQPTVLALGSTNGILRWQRDVGAVQSQPLPANGAVYVGAKNGTIYKLNPNNGVPFWTNGIFPAGVTLTNDLVFDAERNRVLATGSDGRFFALNDLGVSSTLAWSNNLSGALAAAPAILAPNFDKVYVGSRTGRVYQVNAVNGQVESFGTFGFNGPMFQLIGDSDDGGPAITRLLAMGASGVVRASIPWGLGPLDKGGVSPTSAAQLVLERMVQPSGVTAVGDPVTYTLTVQNFGPATAGYVTLWDTLPAGLAFRSATVSQGTFCISGRELIAELGAMLPSAAFISLVVTSSMTGTFQHTAAIGGYYRDSTLGDNSTLISHVVGVVPLPALSIEQSEASVRVSWSTNAAGYTLICNTNLGSSNWVTATPAPEVVNGFYTVTNTPTGVQKFYQLRKP